MSKFQYKIDTKMTGACEAPVICNCYHFSSESFPEQRDYL